MKGSHAFLFFPTSGQLSAGLPDNIKFSSLPVALVITPPIRTESGRGILMREESDDNKATITAWTLIHVCVHGQSLLMSEEPIPKDDTTHGQWNITAIPYK